MHVRRITAGIAALLLPMGACSDGESKADPPESTATHSPTPSKSPTNGPTLPPEAQGTDEAAAKAFVKFYFELISEAMVTGDMGTLRRHSAPRCQSCNALMRNLEEVYEKGGRFDTRGWATTKLATDPVPDPGQIAFLARVKMHERVLLDSEGRVVTTEAPKNQAMHLLLVHRSERWRMLRMGMM